VSHDHYLDQFTRLSVNKNRKMWTAATTYRAPHKPILLLAVLDLFEQGSLPTNLIELTPELGELFAYYWHRIRPPSQRGQITYPFYHLQSDGFWQLLPRPGQEGALAVYRPNAGLAALRDLILGARLDDELYALLQLRIERGQLRYTLVTTYFSEPAQEALLAQTAVNVAAFRYSEELLAEAHTTAVIKERDIAPAVRDQGFRRAIVIAYDHRCAICGLRILTAEGHTAVAAAHIIPWSVSRNDDPRNGLALCHLCHWTFDKGLVTFTDRYLVKTSPQLATTPNLPGHLLTFAGRGLIGPGDDALWPFVEAVRWHRRELFHGR
jgi:putative restriction endonuclease